MNRLVVGLLACGVVLTFSPASADPWGNNSADGATGAHPDGSTHSYCVDSSVSSDVRTSINNAAFEALDITDAVVDFVASCGGSTDVVWFQSSQSPPDKYGDNNCQSPYIPLGSTIHCDQYYNRLYPNKYNVSPFPNKFQMKVACHEFGHSVGLTHGTEGAAHCMSNGVLYTEATSYRRYVSHHIVDHINQWW